MQLSAGLPGSQLLPVLVMQRAALWVRLAPGPAGLLQGLCEENAWLIHLGRDAICQRCNLLLQSLPKKGSCGELPGVTRCAGLHLEQTLLFGNHLQFLLESLLASHLLPPSCHTCCSPAVGHRVPVSSEHPEVLCPGQVLWLHLNARREKITEHSHRFLQPELDVEFALCRSGDFWLFPICFSVTRLVVLK